MVCNTAIFYDIENLMGLFGVNTDTELHLDEVHKRVLAMDGVTGVSIQRAYADWGMMMYRNLRGSILQIGIEPIQIFNTNQNDKVKNAADINLIIDAVDISARNAEIKNFVIASGDGIFAFLSKKLHEHGKRVIGCGFEKITNPIFRNSCDFFIGLQKAEDNIIINSAARSSKSKGAVVQSAHVSTAPRKEVQSLPKIKYTDILMKANIQAPQDAGDTSGVMQLVCRIIEVLFTDDTRDMPGLEISILSSYICHYVPNFKVYQHKFKRIKDFIRLVTTGSKYCVYTVSKTVVLVSTREVAENSGGDILHGFEDLLVVSSEGERYNSIFDVPDGTQFVYTHRDPSEKFRRGLKSKRKPKGIEQEPATQKPTTQETATQEPTPQEPTPQEPTPQEPTPQEPTPQEPAPQEPTPQQPSTEYTIRKLAKIYFEELAGSNALSDTELSNLATPDYALKTFGVRVPIIVDVTNQNEVDKLRMVNGKMKYWKETFHFGDKKYLVYKEWANIHKSRFMAWYVAHKK